MRLLALLLALMLAGCSATTNVGNVYSVRKSPAEPPPSGKTIFLTIDGTGNSQISRTNAARLFEMVDARSGQEGSTLATYYAEGVGSRGDIAGLALGAGMSKDIKQAYEYLTRTYQQGDRIYLSGFSRGAFGVRALNGMIALAGIPDLSDRKWDKRRKTIVTDLFRAYKVDLGKDQKPANAIRRQRIEKAYRRRAMLPPASPFEVKVEAMAIWDTVEAMGWPDREMEGDERNPYYFVEVCNVKNVFHALALDDNRVHSFTPIFAKGHRLRDDCPPTTLPVAKNEEQVVREVWFAGAHADVGGSYAPGEMIDGHLPGNSMNWMLQQLSDIGLVAKDTRVFSDELGPIHDAKAYSDTYKGLTRHFRYPVELESRSEKLPKSQYAKPTVHISALVRLLKLDTLDARFAGCPHGIAKPFLLCAADLPDYGFLAEMTGRSYTKLKPCMYKSLSGWALFPDQQCILIECDQRETPAANYCGRATDDAEFRKLLEPARTIPRL